MSKVILFFVKAMFFSILIQNSTGEKGFLSKAKPTHFGIKICLQLTEKSLWFIKIRYSPRFNRKKTKTKKGQKNYLILSSPFFTYLCPPVSEKSHENLYQRTSHLKMKIHVEFLSNTSPVGEWINRNRRKSTVGFQACIWNFTTRAVPVSSGGAAESTSAFWAQHGMMLSTNSHSNQLRFSK